MLEQHLADPARSPAPGHIAGCTICLGRLQGMKAETEQFRRFVFPRTVGKIVAEHARPSSPLRWLWSMPAVAAVAAAVFFSTRYLRPLNRSEGNNLGLAFSVFAGGEGSQALAADAVVPAAASLTFRVHPTAPCHLWVVSVGVAGLVSRRVPADGDAALPIAAGPLALPVSAPLDGRPGPERIYAVCTRSAVPFAEVAKSVREEVRGGEAGLRAGKVPITLPEDAPQATILIEKQR